MNERENAFRCRPAGRGGLAGSRIRCLPCPCLEPQCADAALPEETVCKFGHARLRAFCPGTLHGSVFGEAGEMPLFFGFGLATQRVKAAAEPAFAFFTCAKPDRASRPGFAPMRNFQALRGKKSLRAYMPNWASMSSMALCETLSLSGPLSVEAALRFWRKSSTAF